MSGCTVSLNSVNGGAGGLGGTGRPGVAPSGPPGLTKGGGLLVPAGLFFGIQNNLVAGNSSLMGPDCYGEFDSGGHNLVGIVDAFARGFRGIGDQTNNSGNPIHPLLGPLLFHGGPTPTMALLPGSPAIDKGIAVTSTDQRGRPRAYDFLSIPNASGGDGSDIGAFEADESRLKIKKAANNVLLSWSTNAFGYRLQSAQVTAPAIWSDVPVAPIITGGEYTMTTNTAAGKRFYRLSWTRGTTIPGLFNTGVGDNGDLLASGAVDPHWRLVQSADPAFPGPDAIVLNDTGFPIPPWVTNGPASKWIAPQASQAVGNLPGDYHYQITFNLTGLNPSTAVIVGHWTSDNLGTYLLINGVATGVTSDGNFGALGNAFTISNGFLPGLNTLEFVVNNAGPGTNPTGLRVQLSGTADSYP